MSMSMSCTNMVHVLFIEPWEMWVEIYFKTHSFSNIHTGMGHSCWMRCLPFWHNNQVSCCQGKQVYYSLLLGSTHTKLALPNIFTPSCWRHAKPFPLLHNIMQFILFSISLITPFLNSSSLGTVLYVLSHYLNICSTCLTISRESGGKICLESVLTRQLATSFWTLIHTLPAYSPKIPESKTTSYGVSKAKRDQ